MDSIEDGATIRIGFKRHYDKLNPTKVSFRTPTYSLKINKKTIFASYCAGREKDFMNPNIAKGIAGEIAGKIKEKGINKYLVLCDERLEEWSNNWVSHDVDYIGNKLEKIFRDEFENIIEKPAINSFQGIMSR